MVEGAFISGIVNMAVAISEISLKSARFFARIVWSRWHAGRPKVGLVMILLIVLKICSHNGLGGSADDGAA